MWIRAIYCTKDTTYAERLARFFDREYGSKIELNICTSIASLFDFISRCQTDIVLFGEEFEQEALDAQKDIPCTCALMMEQVYETEEDELPRIDKFQRGDVVYKNILDAYAGGGRVKRIRVGEKAAQKQKIYVFASPLGGSGTTTVARAYARKCAVYEKVLYLDFGLLNDIEAVEGSMNGMDDIIFALKSRRNILPLKLTSAAAGTADRVFTYGPCKNALSLLELNGDDAQNLINGITALSEYQKIIIDTGTIISEKETAFMKCADFIICILDKRHNGEKKYGKFRELLEHMEEKENVRILRKMLIFRNKVEQDFQSGVAGWAPYVAADSYDAVIERIARSDSFSNLEMRNAETK